MQSLPAKEPDSLQLSHPDPRRLLTEPAEFSWFSIARILVQEVHGYHGPYEHISVQSMDKVVDMMIELVKIYSTFSV